MSVVQRSGQLLGDWGDISISNFKIDLSNLTRLKGKLGKIANVNINVGWFEGTQYEDGTPVAGVASIQEFGSASRSIPPRPFFRPTIDDKKEEWAEKMVTLLDGYINDDLTSEQAFNVFGSAVVGDVQSKISTISTPKLSPITIALRRLRNDGAEINGSLVGRVARAIAEGQTEKGELGDQSYPNVKPLNDTGYMLATLTYNVRD